MQLKKGEKREGSLISQSIRRTINSSGIILFPRRVVFSVWCIVRGCNALVCRLFHRGSFFFFSFSSSGRDIDSRMARRWISTGGRRCGSVGIWCLDFQNRILHPLCRMRERNQSDFSLANISVPVGNEQLYKSDVSKCIDIGWAWTLFDEYRIHTYSFRHNVCFLCFVQTYISADWIFRDANDRRTRCTYIGTEWRRAQGTRVSERLIPDRCHYFEWYSSVLFLQLVAA